MCRLESIGSRDMEHLALWLRDFQLEVEERSKVANLLNFQEKINFMEKTEQRFYVLLQFVFELFFIF